VVIEDYHEFLASATKLLQAVDEKQQVHRWDSESTVFSALGWLQSLWASRTAVSAYVVIIQLFWVVNSIRALIQEISFHGLTWKRYRDSLADNGLQI